MNTLTTPTPRMPILIENADEACFERYLAFFAAHIRNRNTRAAYSSAAERFFGWCASRGVLELERLSRLHVAAYIEEMSRSHAAPTVKQHLAAIRMLLGYLGTPRENPAEGVRGPRHVVRTGRTPVLAGDEARRLLDLIPTDSLAGLRDRALIGLMIYTFARVSAVIGMRCEDYYMNGSRRWVRLAEKGGRAHSVPMHHRAEEYVDDYLRVLAAERECSPRVPMFVALDQRGHATDRPMSRFAAWEMVKRRARAAGVPPETTNHTFRATGITVYLQNGGSIENARLIAAHASIKTTQTYDRRGDSITLDEISRIRL